MSCGHQLRAIPGAVIGYDMTAVLNMAQALGVPALAVAELFPPIEAAAISAMNTKAKEQDHD